MKHFKKIRKVLKYPALKQSRFSKVNLLVFVLVFAAIGGYIIYRSLAAGPATANVWVAPQGLANGAGSECVWHATPVAAPSDPTQACGDLQAANLVAPAAGGLVLIEGDSSTPYLPTGYNSGNNDACQSYCAGAPPAFPACNHIAGDSNSCLVEDACRPITGNNHTAYLMFEPASTADPVFVCHQSISTNFIAFSDSDSSVLSTAPGNLRLGGLYPGNDHMSLTNVDITCQDAAPYPLITSTQGASSVGPGAGTTGNFCSAFVKGTMQDFTMTGGSIGPFYEDGCGTNGENVQEGNAIGYSYSDGGAQAQHIVFNGVYNHGDRFGEGAPLIGTCTNDGYTGSAHTENYYFTDVNDVTVENETFDSCGDSTGIFVTSQTQSTIQHVSSTNVKIVGNTFHGPLRCGIDVGDFNAMTVAYNDFPAGGMTVGGTPDGSTINLVGNIVYENVCPHNITPNVAYSYSHNIWEFNTATGGSTSNCGGAINGDQAINVSHDPNADIFVNYLAGDYHLKAGSPAIDNGDINDYLLASPDHYGTTRYKGSAPDIGAAEYVPPSNVANLWIDTNGGTCTRQATPGAYIDAQACSSMQAAMTAAQAGDTVIMKNGTYPAQTISSGTKTSPVSFYAETYDQAVTAKDAYSATTGVFVSSLSLGGVDKIHIFGIQATPTPNNSRTDAHLTYAGGGGLAICDTGCTSTATSDILVDGFHGRNAFIRATGVTIDHSSFGGWDACYDTSGNHLASGVSGTEDGFRFWDGTGGSGTPTNSTVRNSVFHDIIMGVNDSEENSVCTFGSSLGPHSDCMQNNGGSGITVENNIFFNCPSSDIQWNPFSGATLGTQTIQNNYFGSIGGTGNGTVLGGQGSGWDCSGITVRNNFYNNVGINASSGCTAGNMQVYGNIIGNNCYSSQTANYHDNIFTSTNTCGTNTRVCTPNFVSAPPTSPNWLATSTPDFHLASSDTCAKDHGYSTFPPADFEGTPRPQGTASDAGPDEVTSGGSPTPGDINNDTKVDVLDLSILLSHYNQAANSSQGDLNSDGTVNVQDLSVLLSHWGL